MKKQLISYMLLLLIITGSITLNSCEKPAPEEEPRILQEDEQLFLKPGGDIKTVCWNIYSVAKQIYLWELPSTTEFNPEQYAAGDIVDRDKIIFNLLKDMIKYSKGEDQFSFITTQEGRTIHNKPEKKYILKTFQEIGVTLRLGGGNTYCALVDMGSPAEQAGVKRGDICIKQVGNNFTFYNKEFKKEIVVTGNLLFSEDPVSYFNSFSIQKDNGVKEKVGYLMYKTFDHENTKPLDDVFKYFEQNSVSTLIIDLRYNVGGRADRVKYLIDLILPNRIGKDEFFGNKTISNIQYNSIVRTNSAYLLKNIFVYHNKTVKTYFDVLKDENSNSVRYFSKKGNLETVKRIYFITSGSTASASENLINSLMSFKDEIPIKIIGQTTVGKGFGSMTINVNGYTLNLMMYRYLNADKQALPSNGINPDINKTDYVGYDIGSFQEPCLKAAIADIKKGGCLGCNMF